MFSRMEECAVPARPGRSALRAAMLVAAMVSTGCAAGSMAPPPDAAPTELMPTMAGHPGRCYTVNLTGMNASMISGASELRGFSAPKYIYLDTHRRHTEMLGSASNGTEELPWADSREARWMADQPYPNSPTPFGHAHWWEMNDATIRMGFASVGQYWVGFDARPTTEGLAGVFQFWNGEEMSEASAPSFEVSSTMALVDCRETPMVVF